MNANEHEHEPKDMFSVGARSRALADREGATNKRE